jgi:hypothetical protein
MSSTSLDCGRHEMARSALKSRAERKEAAAATNRLLHELNSHPTLRTGNSRQLIALRRDQLPGYFLWVGYGLHTKVLLELLESNSATTSLGCLIDLLL